jgi:hypothetical protein
VPTEGPWIYKTQILQYHSNNNNTDKKKTFAIIQIAKKYKFTCLLSEINEVYYQQTSSNAQHHQVNSNEQKTLNKAVRT